MFLGHYAIGYAAKKAVPKISLGTYFIAAQFIDLLWPLFVIVGLEKVRIDPGNTSFTPLDFSFYPFSHSLAATIVWGAIVGGIYYLVRKDTKGGLLLGGVVISHWILDFITHRPDLPLITDDSPKVGLGLWYSVAGTVAVELLLFVGGFWLYLKATKAKDAVGRFGAWGLGIFFLLVYLLNLTGPPPPSTEAIAYAGLALWLIVLLAYWIDKHRAPGDAIL